MSIKRKYRATDIKYMLNTIITHSLFHMYELEKQVSALKLKQDGTDKEEDLNKARIFTLVLTILNDSIHSAHGYCAKMFDPRVIDRYVKNQKLALDNKLVNPCSCMDCKDRGYDKLEMAVERSDNKEQCDTPSGSGQQQD